jgi:CheY-like chemotaxis protein
MAVRGTLGPLTTRQQQAMQASSRSADRLSRLTSEMLLMTRLKSGRMTLDHRPFGLKALVEEAITLMSKGASSSGVSLVLRPASEVFVRGDRERLLDVLVHLLDRAVGQRRASDEVVLTLATLDGAAVLALTDSGTPPFSSEPTREPTVPSEPEARERVRSPESDLGPSLPRHIARLHGGNVRVTRGPSGAETVILSLPLFAGAVGPERPVPQAVPGDGLLLVEDDDDCREVVKQLLESEGFSVTAVRDGAEAVAALAASLPAMVLLDLGLGDGDGRTVLRHIRSEDRLSRIPVFVVSGRAESAAGFEYDGPERIDGFFEKPLNLPRVLAAIRTLVGPPED